MKKFTKCSNSALISFASHLVHGQSMGYAQFFPARNSVNENQTEDNLDNEEVESTTNDENKIEKIIMKMKQKVHP